MSAAQAVVLFPQPFKNGADTGKAIDLVARAIMAEREHTVSAIVSALEKEPPLDTTILGLQRAVEIIEALTYRQGD